MSIAPIACPKSECRLRALMLTLRDEMATMLDRMTLADRLDPEPAFIDTGVKSRQRTDRRAQAKFAWSHQANNFSCLSHR